MSSSAQQSNTPAAAATNTSSILEALASMARQNTTAPAVTPSVPAQSSSYNMPNAQNNPAQQMASMNPQFPFTPSTQSVNVPAPAATFAPQAQGSSNAVQNFPSNPTMSYGALPQPISQGAINPNLQAQIAILQTLAAQGIPQEQLSAVLAALNPQGMANNAGAGAGLVPPVSQFPGTNLNQNGWSATPQESRDRSGYSEPVRSPPGRYRRRSRSPSPTRPWGARDSPSARRRDETGYGDYGRDSPGRGRGDDRGRGRGTEYRQRSPPRRGRSPTPPGRIHDNSQMGRGEKWVDYDPAIGKGNIKGVHGRCLLKGPSHTNIELL
jgi:protein NRD1